VLDIKIRAWPTHAANKPIAMIPTALPHGTSLRARRVGAAEFEPPSLDDWPKIAWTRQRSPGA